MIDSAFEIQFTNETLELISEHKLYVGYPLSDA